MTSSVLSSLHTGFFPFLQHRQLVFQLIQTDFPSLQRIANMSILPGSMQKELASFQSLTAKDIAPVPLVGDKGPISDQIDFTGNKRTIVTFLRHCGCPCTLQIRAMPPDHQPRLTNLTPVAEKTFRRLTAFSVKHPEVRCIAVSHSSPEATDRWVVAVGGEWEVEVVVDPGRELYAQWGLGPSTAWHALSPWTLYRAYRLGQDEGIWNRATESGSRWQTGGVFAVDEAGFVRHARVAATADEVPDFDEVLAALDRGRNGLP